MPRVKVSRLNEDGQWDDQGTGHVTMDYMENQRSPHIIPSHGNRNESNKTQLSLDLDTHFPKLTSTIQSKKDQRSIRDKNLTANLHNTTTTTHGSSPSVNVTPIPDLSSPSVHVPETLTQEPHLSSASAGLQTPRHWKKLPLFEELISLDEKYPWFETVTQEPDLSSASARTIDKDSSPTDVVKPITLAQSLNLLAPAPRYGYRLPVFEELISLGEKYPWKERVTQEPDLSSSGKRTMSANSPSAPFTLRPPRQASLFPTHQFPETANQRSTHIIPLQESSHGNESNKTQLSLDTNYPPLTSTIQSKKDQRSIRDKNLSANLRNHASETVTQESGLASASDDKLPDDEITGQDHSALDDKLQ